MNELKNEPLSRVRSIYALPVFIQMLLAEMNAEAKDEGWSESKCDEIRVMNLKADEMMVHLRLMIPKEKIKHTVKGGSRRVYNCVINHLCHKDGTRRSYETRIYTFYRICEELHERGLWALPDCEAARRYDELFRIVVESALGWVNDKPDLVNAWEDGSKKRANKMIEEWQRNGLFQKPIRFN